VVTEKQKKTRDDAGNNIVSLPRTVLIEKKLAQHYSLDYIVLQNVSPNTV